MAEHNRVQLKLNLKTLKFREFDEGIHERLTTSAQTQSNQKKMFALSVRGSARRRWPKKQPKFYTVIHTVVVVRCVNKQRTHQHDHHHLNKPLEAAPNLHMCLKHFMGTNVHTICGVLFFCAACVFGCIYLKTLKLEPKLVANFVLFARSVCAQILTRARVW